MSCGCGIFCQGNGFWHWPTDLLQEPIPICREMSQASLRGQFLLEGNPNVWKNHYILLIYNFCLAIASFRYDSSEADMKDVKKGTSQNRAAHFHFI